MNKRILITGASGMLGATLVNELSKTFDVYATGNTDFKESYKNYLKFDLGSQSYEQLINWSKPDVIVHCAAITNGNYCNLNPKEAFDINGISLNKIIKSTSDKVKIIYISSDAVFPSKTHMAKEIDPVFPENVYGKSKEIGEFYLLNSNRLYTIIRTTIVGFNLNSTKSSFIEWILTSVKKNKEIGLFDDVIFTPISIYQLSNEINFLITENQIKSEVLHISGVEKTSKYNFGINLINALNLSTDKIKSSSILAFKDRAKRCTDQTLDTSYYQNKYKRQLPNLAQTIQVLKDKYYESN